MGTDEKFLGEDSWGVEVESDQPLLRTKADCTVRANEMLTRLTNEEMKRMGNKATATTFHRDGTVTYWSVYQQSWCHRSRFVSTEELAAMSASERERVQEHLRRHKAREE